MRTVVNAICVKHALWMSASGAYVVFHKKVGLDPAKGSETKGLV